MTSSKFCSKCGAPLEAGQAFCSRCGASIAEQDAAAGVRAPIAPVAAVPNNFCDRCGAQLEAGTRFCSRCGAPIEDGAAVVTSDVRHSQMAYRQGVVDTEPPPKKTNWLLYVGGGIVAVIALLVIIGAVAGDDDDDKTSSSSAAVSSSPTADAGTPRPAGTGTAVSGTPRPAATAAATGPRVAQLPKEVPINAPAPTGVDALISTGYADEKAASAITNSLKSAGLNMTGLTVAVFPIKGASGQLAVIDADQSAPAFSSSGNLDEKKLAAAVLSASKGSNITRLAVNIRGKDTKGSYVLTATMSATVLEGIQKGTIAQADLSKQIQIGVVRK